MGENIAAYSALREHILQKENQIANETIYMYVTYFALLTVGSIWSSWLSLLPFFCLIVFQSMINIDQWAIIKASTYIKVFFEMTRNDIHWELLQEDTFCLSVANETINGTIGWYICKWGATILSLISFLSIIVPILHDSNYQFYTISFVPSVRIVIAFTLCIITFHVNRQYFSLRGAQSAAQRFTDAVSNFRTKKSTSGPDTTNSKSHMGDT